MRVMALPFAMWNDLTCQVTYLITVSMWVGPLYGRRAAINVWGVMSCSYVVGCQRFRAIYCRHVVPSRWRSRFLWNHSPETSLANELLKTGLVSLIFLYV
jgi:hypothetical protein